jgi:CRP-like cAMP-binding protein
VFRGLSEESLELLASVAQRRSYRRGELILPEQHDDDTVFVVVSGGVRLYLLGPGGQELTLFRRRTGDMFELGTVAPEWPDETVAEALAHGTVVYAIPWQRFSKCSPPGAKPWRRWPSCCGSGAPRNRAFCVSWPSTA